METIVNKTIGRVNISVNLVMDEWPDLSYLGVFSNQWKEGALEYSTDRNTMPYFIPENPEYGQEDMQRMKDYNNNQWMMVGIVATVSIDGREIGNYSVWGFEYEYKVEDYHMDESRSIARQSIREAREFISSLQPA